jgi:hypothetical protein
MLSIILVIDCGVGRAKYTRTTKICTQTYCKLQAGSLAESVHFPNTSAEIKSNKTGRTSIQYKVYHKKGITLPWCIQESGLILFHRNNA